MLVPLSDARPTRPTRSTVVALAALATLVGAFTAPAPSRAQPAFVRGDCNGDGEVSIGDASQLIALPFWSGPPPACAIACDADDSGDENWGLDGLYLLAHLFQGGPPPPPPFPDCGADPTPDPLDCGAYACDAPPPLPSPELTLAVPETTAWLGESFDLAVTLTSTGPEAQGWSIGVCHDPARLELLGVDLGAAPAAANGGLGPEYYVEVDEADGWTQCAILNFFGMEVLASGAEHELAVAHYRAIAVPGVCDVTPCETLGAPPVPLRFLHDTVLSTMPTAPAGLVTVVPGFRRGDANGDGESPGVADAIALLSALFQGGAPPPCRDAADFNDDGAVDLSDAIGILEYIVIDGLPPPPPGPECGADPTPDDLDCADPTSCL